MFVNLVTENEMFEGIIKKKNPNRQKSFFFFRNTIDLPNGEARFIDNYPEAPDLLKNLKERIERVYEESTNLRRFDVSFNLEIRATLLNELNI